MAEWNFPECRDEELLLGSGSWSRSAQFERSVSSTGSVDGLGTATAPDHPSEHSWEASATDGLWRCRTRQNLTGASLPQIRRGLARAWRLVLAQQTNEALGTFVRIERQLDDFPPAITKRLHAATQLVRAVGLAFQDDSLPALENALSIVGKSGASRDDHVIATLCRLGYWQLGKFESFHALPRQRPRARWSRS